VLSGPDAFACDAAAPTGDVLVEAEVAARLALETGGVVLVVADVDPPVACVPENDVGEAAEVLGC